LLDLILTSNLLFPISSEGVRVKNYLHFQRIVFIEMNLFDSGWRGCYNMD